MRATTAPTSSTTGRRRRSPTAKATGDTCECFILKAFPMVFRIVKEIHAVKGAGYRNSLGLLKRKTEEVIRSIRSRYERRQFADHDPLLDWEPDFGKIRFGVRSRDGEDDGLRSGRR